MMDQSDVTLKSPGWPDAPVAASPRATAKFEVGDVFAQGGMGAILNACELPIRRQVAMKVMRHSGSSEDVARFVREGQITGQLEHPNIVPVHELSADEEGRPFYTMKLVRGVSLRSILEELRVGSAEALRKYPLPVLLTILQKVCDGVGFAHSRQIVHRDLKPENIMLGEYGEALVMDWGLAKEIGSVEGRNASPAVASSWTAGHDSDAMTMAGVILGTPHFMSPEQARGEGDCLDQRADIYALGAILYQILTLQTPVEGKEVAVVLENVRQGRIVAPALRLRKQRLPHLPYGLPPASLSAVAMKALANDPAARYGKVADLQAELTAYQNGFATAAEKAGTWTQLGLLLRRHKAASLGLLGILLTGTVVGAKAVVERGRAEREAARANAALADLKKSAPSMRQLADGEAVFQRFDSALEKLEAAIALDPEFLPAYWRRAWLLLGKEDFAGCAAAIRKAEALDPANRSLAEILPVIDQLAAAGPAENRWTSERSVAVYSFLGKVRGHSELVALAERMRLNSQANEKLIRQRVDQWLGPGRSKLSVDKQGLIELILPRAVTSIEPLRGLPINGLSLANSGVTDLDPLRGMPLVWIELSDTKPESLEPLRDMPLRSVTAYHCPKLDWAPLRGAPIARFLADGTPMAELSFLAGAPLRNLSVPVCGVKDISALSGAPLETADISSYNTLNSLEGLRGAPLQKLFAHGTFSDLSPLRGAPLNMLRLRTSALSSLEPLRGSPLETLCLDCQVEDFTPLLEVTRLQRLEVTMRGRGLEVLRNHPSLRTIRWFDFRSSIELPVAEFWPHYEAMLAKEAEDKGKAQEALVASKTSMLADGTTVLDLTATGLTELPPSLRGRTFFRILLSNNPLSDLTGLAAVNLKQLHLDDTGVSNLGPITDLPLSVLKISGTKVADISALSGMPLETFMLDRTKVTDLRPLLGMPNLRHVRVPKQSNFEILRTSKTLERIGWEEDAKPTNNADLPAAKFWERWDLLKAQTK